MLAAASTGARIRSIVACPKLIKSDLARTFLAEHADLPALLLEPSKFRQLAMAPEPQGIGAVIDLLWQPLEQQKVTRHSLWLGVEAVRNPGNLGTILRGADAAGADTILVFDRSADGSPSGLDPHNPAVVRSSMGGIFSLNLVRATHSQFRKWGGRFEITALGATPEAETDYRRISYRRPILLMLGSERKGLSPGQENSCDQFVRIPMSGRCTSLNIAMAATVLLYEAYAQRHPK